MHIHLAWQVQVCRTLYTIIRTDNQIFIFDRGYRGKRIELTTDGLRVYHNRTFLSGWTLTGS